MSATSELNSPPLLSALGVTYSYGRSQILNEISFDLASGEFMALLGPNGSGKSTLLKAIAGILPFESKKSSGQIRYLGQSLANLSHEQRAQRIAYVGPELRVEFPLTAQEAVQLGRINSNSGISVESAMQQCCCWELRNRDLNTLSGGERQLVWLARALVQGARVLLLDEALSKMDLNHQVLVGRMLQNLCTQGYAIVLVAHDLNLAAEWANSCVLLKQGNRVAHGLISQVLTSENMQHLYPGAEIAIEPSPSSGTPKVFFKRRQ